MKKLMFAVMIVSALSGYAKKDEVLGAKAAQVYDLNVSVKTTVAKSAKLKGNPFVDSSDKVVYRAQATQKWKGVIWGCDCNSLAGKWQVIDDTAGSVAGCVLWQGTKPNTVLFLDDVDWHLLNAIDKKGDKCEGGFTLGDMNGDSDAFLCFAGFGMLAINYTSTPCEDPELNCTSYLKSMTGNVAGWMPAPVITTAGKPGKCVFCGENEEGEEGSTDLAEAWDFCPCEEYANVDLTAISGTWTLKFNSKLSKKLENTADITEVYSLPESVKTQVKMKIIEVLGK